MTTDQPLKVLSKMYISQHALAWCEFTPDDPRLQQPDWEQWPGRLKSGCARDAKLRPKYEQIIREANHDEGMFWLPVGGTPNTELLELARQYFGSRCVVSELGADLETNRHLLGDDFVRGLEEDRQQAMKIRGPVLTDDEWRIWERAKAYATDLKKQLEEQGYTFNPATVEFVAFGGDWHMCCANYPIQMGRAWGLAKGVSRRFDLIAPSASPLIIKARAVEQNLPMPEDIRLFIFKTADEAPTWGRYVAQFWEGKHGPMDPPHVVEIEFPSNSVTQINIFGWGISRALGTSRQYDYRGRIKMSVGCGGSTPYPATMVMAEESLSLEGFRDALLSGQVKQRQGLP